MHPLRKKRHLYYFLNVFRHFIICYFVKSLCSSIYFWHFTGHSEFYLSLFSKSIWMNPYFKWNNCFCKWILFNSNCAYNSNCALVETTILVFLLFDNNYWSPTSNYYVFNKGNYKIVFLYYCNHSTHRVYNTFSRCSIEWMFNVH